MSRAVSQVPDDERAKMALEILADFILDIRQPPPFEHNKIYTPFNFERDTPEDMQETLEYHHVTPKHLKLILALYRSERKATDVILAPVERGRFYTVDADKPTDTSGADKLGFDAADKAEE